MVGSCDLWAFDLESTTADVLAPHFRLIGLGLANADLSFYISLENLSPEVEVWLKDWITSVRLTCFNAMFDCTAILLWTGKWPRIELDSYALFKQLANESYPGQSWSLEVAIDTVLGWEVSNKTALAAALAERGLKKSELYKLPVEVVGPYCAMDADAAWQLAEELIDVCNARQLESLKKLHQREFLTQVRLLAEQQIRGMRVDREQLTTYRAELAQRIALAMSAFLSHPEVAPHIREYEAAIHATWMASAPAPTTKTGKVAVRFEKWQAREAELPKFNPNSKTQLRWLFFDRLKLQPILYTKSGLPEVSKKTLPSLGEPGGFLNKYNLLVKELGYVDAWLEKSSSDGLLHPAFKSMGTVTWRLGGSGGVNVQQAPKKTGFMQCVKARPGFKLVEADAEALEPTILAGFSEDPTLWKLYGPAAKPNDLYLFLAASIDGLREEVRKHYDPDNPTPEGIAAAKKHCKLQRSIAKVVALASNYKAGPRKIHETLSLAGIKVSFTEVKKIHAGYWQLFSGVSRFYEVLERMWRHNGGFFPSALGTPITVPDSLVKDLGSRFCQSSASLTLLTWIYHTERLRSERGVEMYPWIVNWHDEQIWEAPEDQAEAASQILMDALACTNAELNFPIPIKSKPQIADSLAEIKCE